MRLTLLLTACLISPACFLDTKMMVSATCNDGSSRAAFFDTWELNDTEKAVIAARLEADLCKDQGGIFKLHSRMTL